MPLMWMFFIDWGVRLAPMRENYSELWTEHDDMKRMNASVSSSGGSLSDVFEYMCTNRGYYLEALELFLLAGVMPALVAYFLMAMRKANT